jgi:hypothetical protein
MARRRCVEKKKEEEELRRVERRKAPKSLHQLPVDVAKRRSPTQSAREYFTAAHHQDTGTRAIERSKSSSSAAGSHSTPSAAPVFAAPTQSRSQSRTQLPAPLHLPPYGASNHSRPSCPHSPRAGARPPPNSCALRESRTTTLRGRRRNRGGRSPRGRVWVHGGCIALAR